VVCALPSGGSDEPLGRGIGASQGMRGELALFSKGREGLDLMSPHIVFIELSTM